MTASGDVEIPETERQAWLEARLATLADNVSEAFAEWKRMGSRRDEVMVDLFKEGTSRTKLAILSGMPVDSVNSILRRNGQVIRPRRKK